MTAAELSERLIEFPDSVTHLVGAKAPPGTSREFHKRVLQLFAADHSKLHGLASTAKHLIRSGDDVALAYRTLAIVLRVEGKWRASAKAFIQAGEFAPCERDRLAFQTGAIDCLARGGKPEEAVDLAIRLRSGLRDLGEAGLAARVSLNLSYALMQQDRYSEALRELEGLAGELAEAGFPVEAASARLAHSTSLLFGGDLQRALSEGMGACREAEALGMDQLADISRGNVAYAYLLRGDADLALAELLAIRDRQREVPLEYVRILEYLGDVYQAMNLWTEASDAYREALALDVSNSTLHRAHIRLGLGQTLMRSGQTWDGRREVEAARRLYARLKNRTWQAAAETVLAETPRKAKRAVQRARMAGSQRHLLHALIAYAEQGGDDSAIREAARLVEKSAITGLGWRIFAERAKRGTGGARLRNYRRMFEMILADQARTSSFASRGAIMRDKTEALSQYIGCLLEAPSPKRVVEALSVVLKSRSISLLDELLHTDSRPLTPAIQERLRSLRSELNAVDEVSSARTRHGITGSRLDRLQRKWLEETNAILTFAQPQSSSVRSDTAIFLQSSDGFRAISSGKVRTWRMSPKELDDRLRWLNYELLAPMVDREASPVPALNGLADLGKELLSALSDSVGVCPDGVTWRIPWLGCLDAVDDSRPLEIRLHPSFHGGEFVVEDGGRILWIAEHDDLPWAAREAAEFLGAFPDARVCRSAKEARLTLQSGTANILHVIAHARHQVRTPMLSTIDFVDGPILAAEIARSGLRVRLVTLSGCDTGRISDSNRLEPDGHARAFLSCGANYVIGSAWPLDDEAAVRLYGSFYQSILSGATVHASLRSARRDVREWNAHPYFWASPLLYGGYRA